MKHQPLVLVLGVLILSACVRQPVESTPPELAPAVIISPGKPVTTPATPLTVASGITLTDGALSLTILSPADGVIVAVSPVELIVLSTVETVFTINGDLFIIPPGKQSTFLVSLMEGYNSVELVASDYEGNQVETILTIIYEQ